MIGSPLASSQTSTAEQQYKQQGSCSKQDPVISGSLSSSSTKDPENLKLYTNWSRSSPATASFKVDGSFIIAFIWDDRVRVTTRRRMNSEQVTHGTRTLQYAAGDAIGAVHNTTSESAMHILDSQDGTHSTTLLPEVYTGAIRLYSSCLYTLN